MNKELEHRFVEQLQKHQNIVHKVCRLYTNNADAHNDLFQEITIQLWRAYPKFRGDSKFSTWMYRVGLNEAVQQLNDIEKALVFLYLEDKDYREISATLGISEVNARVKMNRVKKKLRTILNP